MIPKLEGAQPIVEKLSQDAHYAKTIQLRNNDPEFETFLNKIGNLLDQFGNWYCEFQSSGMSPELESVDYELLARLNGLWSHTLLWRRHRLSYLSQNIDKLSDYCSICNRQLTLRLSS